MRNHSPLRTFGSVRAMQGWMLSAPSTLQSGLFRRVITDGIEPGKTCGACPRNLHSCNLQLRTRNMCTRSRCKFPSPLGQQCSEESLAMTQCKTGDNTTTLCTLNNGSRIYMLDINRELLIYLCKSVTCTTLVFNECTATV